MITRRLRGAHPLSMVNSSTIVVVPRSRLSSEGPGQRIRRNLGLPTLHIHEAVSKAVKITASAESRRESKRSVSRVFAVTLKRSITDELTRWWPKNRCRFTTIPPQPRTYLYTCIATDRRNTSLLINRPSIDAFVLVPWLHVCHRILVVRYRCESKNNLNENKILLIPEYYDSNATFWLDLNLWKPWSSSLLYEEYKMHVVPRFSS